MTMFVHFQPKLDDLNKQVNDLNDIISLMKEEHLTFVSTFKTDNKQFND
jgi:inorganic pyrophosphatase